MDSQPTTAAVAQHREIALGLRRLYDPERVLLTGHRHVFRIVAGDLNEDSVGWPTLVGLAGRMEEARTEAEAGRSLGSIADELAHGVECTLVFSCHLDVGEERDVALTDVREVFFQRGVERFRGGRAIDFNAFVDEDRSLEWQSSGFLERCGEFARFD